MVLCQQQKQTYSVRRCRDSKRKRDVWACVLARTSFIIERSLCILMEIIARSIWEGESIYLVSDGGETYPIMEDMLHSKIIFDGLIQSGYEFVGLPFKFRKGGKMIDTIETTMIELTQEEEDNLMVMLESERYTTEELSGMMTEDAETYVEEAAGEYTITTREAFLEFLEVFNATDTFTDFRPLNYFVAPSARFTAEEYFLPENRVYVDKLEKYRHFNYIRWVRLLEWFGKELTTFDDVLREYFKWGLDGLYLPYFTNYEKTLTMPENVTLANEDRWAAMFTRRSIGALHKDGTIIVAPEDEGVHWETVQSRNTIASKRKSMAEDEVRPVAIKVPIKQTYFIFEGKEHTLSISTSEVKVDEMYFSPLRVYPNGVGGKAVRSDYCTTRALKLLAEDAYMQALALDTKKLRVEECSASSAKVLELSCMSKRSILCYMVSMMGLDVPTTTASGDAVPAIDPSIIDMYLSGTEIDITVKEYLDGMLSGVYNIGNISKAITAQNSVDTNPTYMQIYVLHRIFGVPIDEIRQAIYAMGEESSFCVRIKDDGSYLIEKPSTTELPMNDNSRKFNFEAKIDRRVSSSFITDIRETRMKAAKECVEFVYVTQAIREMGTVEATRHVGLIGYVVNKFSSVVQVLCDMILEKFTAEVKSKTNNEVEIARWLTDAQYFVAIRYFEIALKGTITYPAQLGGRVETIDRDLRAKFANTLALKAETLTALTEGNVSADTMHFFFVNAYVTDSQVIPLEKQEITQVDMSAGWRDYQHTNPKAYEAVMRKQCLPAGHTPWELWVEDTDYQICLHKRIGHNDFYGYYQSANNFVRSVPNNVVFTNPPLPIEEQYPISYGLVDEDGNDVVEYLPSGQEREGKPKFALTPYRQIHFQDYEYMFDVSGANDEDVAFKPFTGLTSEDFAIMDKPEDALTKTVEMTTLLFVVVSKNKFYTIEDDKVHDYTEIPEFVGKASVCNLHGRVYLVRDSEGNYFRVEV